MAKDTRIKIEDILVRPDEYWTRRFTKQSMRLYDFGDDIIPEVNRLYGLTNNSINDRVNAFYAKYGKIQSSPTFKTLPDGTRVISGSSSKLVVPRNVANKKLKEGTRMSKLQKDIRGDLVEMSKTQNIIMKDHFSVLAKNAYYDTFYELHKGYGVGSSFKLLSPTVVNQLISNPVNGQNFSTRVWNNRDALANQVNQILVDGIIKGESNGQMTKRLAERMGSGRNVAERLIRTEVTNTYNAATKQSYLDSGLVDRYEYLATLDNRTSSICSDLDGQVFKVEDAVTGLNYPPMHPNCRSTTRAYFDNSTVTRLARDVETGNTFTVPADMDVKNYKAIYVDKTLTRKQWDKGKRV